MRRRLFIAFVLLVFGTALGASVEKRCSICGKILPDGDSYHQVVGSKEVFCERCFAEAPRCQLCKLPTKPEDIDPETGVCARCLPKLPRCKACGKPIIGTVYQYPYSKSVYCAECKNNRPACAICGVPVGDRFWKYPDGRTVCSECGARAVFDVELVGKILRDAERTAEKRLGLKLKQPCSLKVELLSGLVPSSPVRSQPAPGPHEALYGQELGRCIVRDGKAEIILLAGLPPELLYEAAAHEYAHAWQVENALSTLDPELREGIAQWVAADVLRAKGYRGALERLEARRDFPYGTGYQRFKAMQLKADTALMMKKH